MASHLQGVPSFGEPPRVADGQWRSNRDPELDPRDNDDLTGWRLQHTAWLLALTRRLNSR
jgi:hypothetical protein